MTRLKPVNRFARPLLFLTLILCACSASLPPTDAPPLAPVSPPPTVTELTPESFPDSPALPIPKFAKTLQTPHIDQPSNGIDSTITPAYEGCGYQWAYKDIPELNPILENEINALDPQSQAWATAFGEDCVYADGHADFGAMETEFYIHKPVTDLTDFETFGNWIVQAMKIIEALPRELIAGPQPGFVEFWFIKNDSEHLIVRVPIQKYRDETTGKSGEELFRLFYTEP